MNKSRTHYAVLNSTISTLIFVINTILKFLTRSIFVYFLGKTYLGINSLFGSIIGMLSLSELGIGGAIVYSLYKPLADDDHVKTKSLMVLYKKIYAIIGLIVGVIGLILLPFIPSIVGNKQVSHLTLIYLLFLFNSVVSYFFSYNSSLLNASQKKYVITLNNFVFSTLTIIFQIIFLYLTHNFIIYLMIAIFFTILGNIMLKRKADKEFAYLADVPTEKLDKDTLSILKKNTMGNFVDKIGEVIVMTTDNIYISLFAGINTVGMYNNYMIIINSANAFLGQLTGGLASSIGNLAATGDGKLGYNVYKKNTFINYSIVYIFSIELMYVMNDFIKLWVGSNYILPLSTVFLIVINYILFTYRRVSLVFISAYGLPWYTRWKVFWESLLNIVFSAIFLIIFHMGLNGVILGTIFSTIFVVAWWEPYALFKYGFKLSIRPFIKVVVKQFIALTIVMALVGIVASHIVVNNWIVLFIKGLAILVISLLCFVIIFGRSEEFKYTVGMITKILKRH